MISPDKQTGEVELRDIPTQYRGLVSPIAYNQMVRTWNIPIALVHERLDLVQSYKDLYVNVTKKCEAIASTGVLLQKNNTAILPYFIDSAKTNRGSHCACLTTLHQLEVQFHDLNVRTGTYSCIINYSTRWSNHTTSGLLKTNSIQMTSEEIKNRVIIEDVALQKVMRLDECTNYEIGTIEFYLSNNLLYKQLQENQNAPIENMLTIQANYFNRKINMSSHIVLKIAYYITDDMNSIYGRQQATFLGLSENRQYFFLLGFAHLQGAVVPILLAIPHNNISLDHYFYMFCDREQNLRIINNITLDQQTLLEMQKCAYELSHTVFIRQDGSPKVEKIIEQVTRPNAVYGLFSPLRVSLR